MSSCFGKGEHTLWRHICAIFAVTGRNNFTANDVFKVIEMPVKKAPISKCKDTMKARLERKMRQEEVLNVLEKGEPTA